MTTVMVVTVAEMTFGQWLRKLRGEAHPADVARRLGLRLTPQHVKRLEEKPEPGGIKLGTIMLLAEAYWERNYPSMEAAFWDLYQRAKLPMPLGYSEGLQGLAEDPKRFAAFRQLIDLVGSWRTDEIERLARDIEDKSDPGSKRLDSPVVEPPTARLPGH